MRREGAGVVPITVDVKYDDPQNEGQTRRFVREVRFFVEDAEYREIGTSPYIAGPPVKTPEMFERFLPYAMAFGVEAKWAKAFEDIYREPPTWYVGTNMSGFNSRTFSSRISALSTRAGSTMSSAPRSSGGSGFSGGGSSGGGGGGGGGGGF